MMEPSTIAAALAAAAHTTSLVKSLAERIKASGKSEVLSDFIELQSAMMELQQRQQELINRVRELDDESRALKARAALDDKLRFNGRFYELGGAGNKDGRYCPVCYDKDGKLIRLKFYTTQNGPGCSCQVCKYDVNLRA